MFDEDGYVATSEIVFFRPDFNSIYVGLREMSTAMFANPFLPLIANEMHKPSRKRVMKMTWVAIVPTAIFIYVVPLFGYLLMIDVGEDLNFLLELDPTDSPEVVIGEIGTLLLSITSNVIFTYFVARSFMLFFNGDRLGSGEERVNPPTVRIFAGATGALLAISINFTNVVFETIVYEIASMGYSVISFVLPGVYYLMQFQFRVFKWGVMSSLILCLGVFLCIMTVIGLAIELDSDGT
jgi:amino acid permease